MSCCWSSILWQRVTKWLISDNTVCRTLLILWCLDLKKGIVIEVERRRIDQKVVHLTRGGEAETEILNCGLLNKCNFLKRTKSSYFYWENVCSSLIFLVLFLQRTRNIKRLPEFQGNNPRRHIDRIITLILSRAATKYFNALQKMLMQESHYKRLINFKINNFCCWNYSASVCER